MARQSFILKKINYKILHFRNIKSNNRTPTVQMRTLLFSEVKSILRMAQVDSCAIRLGPKSPDFQSAKKKKKKRVGEAT